MRYLIFLLTIGLFQPSLNNSIDTQKWYWAYHEENGEVLAYQASGNVNVLLEDVYAFRLSSVDDQTAVVMIEQNNEYAAYILTPTKAHFLAVLYTGSEFKSEMYAIEGPPGVEAVRLAEPYILVWNHDYGPPLLFNRETAEVESFPIYSWKTWAVSKGGQYFRYFVPRQQDGTHLNWALGEYDVLNATNRQIFTRIKDKPDDAEFISEGCRPDTYGENWLCEQSIGIYPPGGGFPLREQAIITLEGATHSLPENWYPNIGLDGKWYFIKSENYHPGCGQDCVVEVHSFPDNSPTIFDMAAANLPERVSFNLTASKVLDQETLLLTDTTRLPDNYFYSAGTGLEHIGGTICAPCTGASPDGEWQILYDAQSQPPRTVIVNFSEKRVVFGQEGLIDWHGYVDGGIYLEGNIFYSFQDKHAYVTELWLYPSIVDILSGGVILQSWPFEEENYPLGIYRYSDEEGLILLIEGANFVPYSFGPVRL